MKQLIVYPSAVHEMDPTKEHCKSSDKCIWCKLAGHHSQTNEERTAMLQQASIGAIVILVIIAVAIGIAYQIARMVRIL